MINYRKVLLSVLALFLTGYGLSIIIYDRLSFPWQAKKITTGYSRGVITKATSSPTKITTTADTMTLGSTTIRVEIADTEIERAQGLSGRSRLGKKEGMLFVFEKPGYYRFWMKEMNFPLDIIWISREQKIVDIIPNLAPDTYPESYGSTAPAQYVVEVPANFATKNHLTIGQTVVLPLFKWGCHKLNCPKANQWSFTITVVGI